MNTTAAWFRGGTQQLNNDYVGNVGVDGTSLVGRFAFTTGSAGASGFSFRTNDLRPAGSSTWGSGNHGNYRFQITSGENDLKAHAGTDGTAVGVYWNGDTRFLDSGGTISVSLYPNTSYYLWIYPDSTLYRRWYIGGVSVTLSGSYGNTASPAASDGEFGHPVPINISGGSSGACYTVTASCAGHTETLQTQGSASYLNWTPALETYGPLLPDSASAQATITVQTFYGSGSVGSRSTTLSLRFRASDAAPVPGAGWVAHSPYNTGASAAISRYIQGISRAQFSFDASKVTTRYGASLQGFRVICGGSTAEESPYRTPILAGGTVIRVGAVDSRGFCTEESVEITPLAYAPPGLAGVSVFRCGADGTAAEDGLYCSVTASARYSALEGDNSAEIRRSLRSVGGNYGGATLQPDGQAVIVSGLDADTCYELKLEITDAVGGSGSAVCQIPGRRWAMKFRPDGAGVAFGMAPQAAKRLELPGDWALVIGGQAQPKLVCGSCDYQGPSTASISCADAAAAGKSAVIALAQDAAQPVVRAEIGAAGPVFTMAGPVTQARIHYLCW